MPPLHLTPAALRPRAERKATWQSGLLWLLLTALLLAALLPSLIRAGGSSSGSQWVEICTTQGMRWVALPDAEPSESPPQQQQPLAQLDCPLCLLQHSPALPSLGLLGPQAVLWRRQSIVFIAPIAPPRLTQGHWRPPLRAPPEYT